MSKFTSRSRAFRLLPGVVLVCGGLLVLKTTGLVHDAFAQETTSADAMGTAQKPVNADFAGSDSQMASAAEVDVLTSLTKRRTELDAREVPDSRSQANMLAATESPRRRQDCPAEGAAGSDRRAARPARCTPRKAQIQPRW